MKEIQPLVSIIVPNYNHSPFIQQRLDSIFNQTMQNFEVILLDDCSTDGSAKILKKFEKHPKVSHALFNDLNSGNPFKQWNKGINLARGEYIWIAESDDWADSSFLETMLNNFRLYPEAGIVLSSSYAITSENTDLEPNNRTVLPNETTRKNWHKIQLFNGRKFIENEMLRYNAIYNASALLIRKSCFDLSFSKPLEFKLCGDWIRWIHILSTTNLVFESKVLNYYRFHNASIRNNISNSLFLKEYSAVILFIIKKINLKRNRRKEMFDCFVYRYNELKKNQKSFKIRDHIYFLLVGIIIGFKVILSHE